MDTTSLAPLLTPQGWALLASLPPYDEANALSLGESLRSQGHSPELVSAALTQQRLRARAASKFGPSASQMLFTPDGLEQATRLAVAAHHANRYLQANVRKVADLGCGIGGESIALAGLDLPVLAVERDEATAALATVNLMPFPHAEVVCADAFAVDLAAAGVDAVFADPARRRGGKRITDPKQWAPPLSQVLALREQVPAVGVKVAPGLNHGAFPADCHAQWVSVGGDVVEAGLWCGPLALEGPGRSALVLGAASAHVLRDPECTDPSATPTQAEPIASPTDLGEYLFEPDGAVIRAGLVSHLAQRTQAQPVGSKIAYLTGSAPLPEQLTPFLQAWRIREVLPLHLKSLKARVRQLGLGRLDIKKRGVEVAPEQLRASLRPAGGVSGPAETWVLTRVGTARKGLALVVEPV
ncbi:class I SAM-dependent methyltransferase [Actinomyces trachealis]|uniref:class I SAM-dependent methyltransferase n=1 Tax=Actinomyces trachealis TaxID=2763540 RepID=UPI0018928945|nr:class I SAM-dependent methyltransferase [Actinomyces trachealis]